MRLGFSARLTLWHGTSVALILAGAALAGDRALTRMVDAQVNSALLTLAETEAASALDDPEGRVHLHEVGGEAGGPSPGRLAKLVQVVDAEGHVLARSASLAGATFPAPPALLARLRAGEVVTETLPDLAGEPVRVVALPIEVDGRFRYAIQVGTSLSATAAFLRVARILFLGMAAAILGAMALFGGFLAKGALRHIDRIVALARRIGESNLRERLPDPGTPDEMGRLVATLNEMLDRIERGFESQRRFTADASHEMRSPLSRLRSELEVTLRRKRDSAEYEAALRSALEEVERLSRLTEELLILARLDAGEAGGAPVTPVALTPLVEHELTRLRAEADQRKIAVSLEGFSDLTVKVPPEALCLVVANLLRNAVKFTPPDGRVTVKVYSQGSQAVLTVSDTGPGIRAEELPRIFERFYRSGASRSPELPGIGLGLSIVRAVVEAHGGRVAVDSDSGAGATFTVRLPLAA